MSVTPGSAHPGPALRRVRWRWPLVCLAQALVYAAGVVLYVFVLWGVYGDGDPTIAENHAAAQVTCVFGVGAAAMAVTVGVVAWRNRPRLVAIAEFVLATAILALAGWPAAHLMLMH